MTSSMTGFAHLSADIAGQTYSVDIKSLNAKGLDVRARVPADLDGFDLKVRKLVQSQLSRGAVTVTVTADMGADTSQLTLNWPLVDSYMQAALALVDRYPGVGMPTADMLLSARGIMDPKQPAVTADHRPKIEASLSTLVQDTLTALQKARAGEGAELAAVIRGQLDMLETLLAQASEAAQHSADHHPTRLSQALERGKLSDTGISEERLAQEVAMLLVRGDIQEELDRFAAHLKSAHALLAQTDPVGRKFDFLCQEMNREANTICSKAQAQDLTEVGMEMKVVIDQIREQIQNIE